MISNPDNTSRYPLRHSSNTNLHLHHDGTFETLPLMVDKGPFVRVLNCIDLTTQLHST